MSYKALHLELDEHVILEVRKHWIVFVGQALALLFIAALPFVLFVVLKTFVPTLLNINNINFFGNKSALFLFLYTLWVLFLWISFFIGWTKYYLDVWYVTEKRIIIIEQKNLFHREISNLRFDKVQDVTLDIEGFIPTLLKFGNIRVQTASENNQEFFMSIVRHPEEVSRIIFSHQNKSSDNKLSSNV
ncbi:MAG: PH domain-containing protein [Candidatus Zambryskibacteria bacterium]|nr:PH domain-containing protein [Candidatus Zambryskibacteria bacterium]